MNASFFDKKKEKNINIRKQYWLQEKNKPLWLIKIDNKELIKDLRDWLLTLQASFIVEVKWVNNELIWKNIIVTWDIKNDDLIWFDFVVCDNNITNLDLYLKNWITPLILKDNHFCKILQEFNPLKNEWNAFFYDEENKWQIFWSIIKYMENYKFPFDNKTLVKNVLAV